MYCKDCLHRNKNRICCCERIREPYELEDNGRDDCLEYCYNEGGVFEVGDYFGCVHFKKKELE